jgi:hypothetical protein
MERELAEAAKAYKASLAPKPGQDVVEKQFTDAVRGYEDEALRYQIGVETARRNLSLRTRGHLLGGLPNPKPVLANPVLRVADIEIGAHPDVDWAFRERLVPKAYVPEKFRGADTRWRLVTGMDAKAQEDAARLFDDLQRTRPDLYK